MTRGTRDDEQGTGVAGTSVLVVTVVLAVCFALPAVAQNAPLQIHGYLKNLGLVSSSVLSSKSRFLDISRLRFKGIGQIGSRLRGEVWLDTEVLAGSFLETIDFDIGRELQQRAWLDLDWQLASASRLLIEQRIFRAFASLYAGPMTVTAGRQRIAWGTGFAWNPTDLFNPFNPAAIELGEKAGIDGVSVSVATGAFSNVEVAYAPAKEARLSSVAARASTKLGEYDVSAMTGYFREEWVVGGDFAGYLGNAGLRGEAALTFASSRSNYLRFTVTADRSFPGDYYAFVEYYFNGEGTRDKERYDFAQLLEGRSFNVARDYVALSVSKPLTPLLGASVYALINIDDRSGLFGPSITYSLSNNAEAGGAVYLFEGKGDTEFGLQSNAYFAYLQFFF